MSDCYPVEPDLQTLLESEARLQDGFLSVQRCGRREQCTRDAKRIAELEARVAELEAERDRLRDITQDLVALAIPGQNWSDGIAAPVLARARAALAKEGE